MPEIPLCIYCRKSIDLDIDDYVISNKDATDDRAEWLYAHLKCHDTAMENEQETR